jgi:hypothetical protein
VVLPTVGRDCLVDTLDSLAASGFHDRDELLVIPDGHYKDSTRATVNAHILAPQVRFIEIESGGFWGHPGRTKGMAAAKKQLVMFTQDDQLFAPGALTAIRRAVGASKDWKTQGHFFRVVPRAGRTVPSGGGSWSLGDIDADCIVLPVRQRALFGLWDNSYNGDYIFISETKRKFEEAGFEFVWHEEVISVQRLHAGRYGQFLNGG